jgi:Tol biopolymer transport system component
MITSRRSTAWNLRVRFLLVALAAFGILLGTSMLLSQSTATIGLPGLERISVNASGSEPSGSSYDPSISADGRFVAFVSNARNYFLPGEPYEFFTHIYVRDRLTNTLERIPLNAAGEWANGDSYHADLSADGRYVAFVSSATNLVPHDTNGNPDVFIYDRDTDTVERISEATSGAVYYTIPSISPDGRYVAYVSPQFNGVTTAYPQAYRYDRLTGEMQLASRNSTGEAANAGVWEAVTAGNDWVFFISGADNLHPAASWYGNYHVFGRNMATGMVRFVSSNSGGAQDGGDAHHVQASNDGRYVTFSTSARLSARDTNVTYDIYVHDLQTRLTQRVSMSRNQSWRESDSWVPSVSGDARFVTFWSLAHELVNFTTWPEGNVYLVDRTTGSTSVIVFRPNRQGIEFISPISDDGRFIVFQTDANDLVPGDSNDMYDIYLVDMETALQGIPDPFPEPVGTATPSPLTAPILLEPYTPDLDCPVFLWQTEPGLYYEFRLGLENPPYPIAYGGTRDFLAPNCPLLNATYYYRMRSIDPNGALSPWSETRSITVDSPPQAVPDLWILDTATPTLSWNAISWATAYQVVVDDSYYWNSPEFVARDLGPDTLLVTVTPPLPNGEYFWRVRARHPDGTWGEWSESGSFLIYVE